MITKKTLSLVLAIVTLSAFGQIELRRHNGGAALINGTSISVNATLSSAANQDVQIEIDAKSIYSSSKTIKVKKYEISSTAPLSKNAICWGVCTIGVVWNTVPRLTSDPITMNSNQTVLFSGHLYPELQVGLTCFRYVWFDVANPNDSTWVDVCFQLNPTTNIPENKTETSLSLFPNPANNELNVRLNSNETNKKIEIIDLLGKKLFSRNIQNNSSSFKINTTNYKPGIYFVSVTSNNKAIKTEKIVITK